MVMMMVYCMTVKREPTAHPQLDLGVVLAHPQLDLGVVLAHPQLDLGVVLAHWQLDLGVVLAHWHNPELRHPTLKVVVPPEIQGTFDS
jgi:hypothetical protein